MSHTSIVMKFLTVVALMTAAASAANATTLNVNCGAKVGLTSIGAALKALHSSEEPHGPATINVSGSCNENVVIQSMDSLTLNAVNGASINDPSLGNNPTVVIDDSRDVAVNGFVINGYSPGVSGQDVVDCQNGSLCRFNGNTVQHAPQGVNVGVFAGSYASITGGLLQANPGGVGLVVANGARVKTDGVTAQGNAVGVQVQRGGFLQFLNSTSSGNGG